MVFPRQLKRGDTVGLYAPSSPVSHEDALLSEQFLNDMGCRVKVADCVYKKLHGYKAGTGMERAADLNKMFADPEIKGIFCIRGGDTSSHVMPHIDIELVRKNPKIFVGFSDVTNFHVYFNQKADLITIHGPMVCSNMIRNYDEFTKKAFEDVLFMDKEHVLENPEGVNFVTLSGGKAEGRLVGGNLPLLTSMIGTPYEVDTKGKILFFEDVNESVNRVDRMLYQLKFAGKFDDAAGVLVGNFSNSQNHSDASYGLHELMEDFFKNYEKPVIDHIMAGHCFPTSTIPLGMNCRMDADEKTILFINE